MIADVKKNAEQGQNLRCLADKHVVHEYVEGEQNDVSQRPTDSAKKRG